MSRSGYSDDCENVGLWRGNIWRATTGKRGQAFFRELVAALDAMPEKRLVQGELETQAGEVCSLGALRRAKGCELGQALKESDWDALGEAFDVAPMLTQEVMHENDERQWNREAQKWNDGETPEERWERMRKWAAAQITPTQEETQS